MTYVNLFHHIITHQSYICKFHKSSVTSNLIQSKKNYFLIYCLCSISQRRELSGLHSECCLKRGSATAQKSGSQRKAKRRVDVFAAVSIMLFD